MKKDIRSSIKIKSLTGKGYKGIIKGFAYRL